MVRIRLKRVGNRNRPIFRVVVTDSRSPRDGRFIEEVGTYQPLNSANNFTLKLDRVQYWLDNGAQPSETVASFIKKSKKVMNKQTAEAVPSAGPAVDEATVPVVETGPAVEVASSGVTA